MSKGNPLKNIIIREGKWGTTYSVRVMVKGQTESKTCDTLPEAITWRDETIALLRDGKTLPGKIASDDMELGKATDKFILGAHSKSHGAIEGYRLAQKQLLEYFGEKKPLSEIQPKDITDFVFKRQNTDRVGPSKIHQELSFIRQVYETAAGWGVAYPSPELNIKRPPRKRPSREDKLDRIIKSSEMDALFAEAVKRKSNLIYFLLFLLYTGMRPSEAAALLWCRMDIKEEKEAIKNKNPIGYVDLKRGGFSRVGTKTETRFVPAHPVVVKLIESLEKIKEKEKRYVFLPDNHKQKDRVYRYFRRSFETSKKNAKVDNIPLRSNIDFYSFRHTARTRMAICGLQDSAAEEIVGHVGKDEMKKVYVHYDDADLINEIKKLNYPWLDINVLLKL